MQDQEKTLHRGASRWTQAGQWAVVWVAAALGAACESETPSSEPRPCEGAAGTICTIIGNGEAGYDGDGNPLLLSSLYWPIDVTVHADGRTWVIDWNNHRVRQVQGDTLQSVIGSDTLGDGPDDHSDLKPEGAVGTLVNLNHPTQLVPMDDGSLLLVAWHNHKLRKFDPTTGRVHVVVGASAGHSGDGGAAKAAQLDQPQAVAKDGKGGLYVLDQRNQVVRHIDAGGVIHTVAGSVKGDGFAGDGGKPLEAKFSFPKGSNPPPGGWVAVDAKGRVYVSDTLNHRIRRLDLAAQSVETVAGTGEAGYGGDGGKGPEAKLNNPRKITFGPDGRLYIGDEKNHRIRALDVETLAITTVVGDGKPAFAGDFGPADKASLWRPIGVSFNAQGEMLVVDTYNHRIRRVIGAIGGK